MRDKLWFSKQDLASKTKWQDTQAQVASLVVKGTDMVKGTSMHYPWTLGRGQEGTVVLYPPEDEAAQLANELLLTLASIEPTGAADTTIDLTITLHMGEETYVCPAPPIPLASNSPKIEKFRAFPSLLVAGKAVHFTWSWDQKPADQPKLLTEAGVAIPCDTPNSAALPSLQAGPARYHLSVRRGSTEARKTVQVQALDSSRWGAGTGWWTGQIASLMVSQEGDTLYAIVRESAERASLWRSPDGFSSWEKIKVTVPAHLATSPGVCFNDKLLLVGGSRIDPNQVANTLYQFDPGKPDQGFTSLSPLPPWQPRMGHACVVFRKQLWVLGGADTNWNALNDIWAWNGQAWEKQGEAPWTKRCMLSATATALELWVAGGLTQPDGKALQDVWKLQGNAWMPVQQPKRGGGNEPLRLGASEAPPASTLVGLTDENKQEHMYVVGYPNTFCRLRENAGLYQPEPITHYPAWPAFAEPPSRLEAVAFNGCLWLFAQVYRGRNRIEGSDLYYWVPPEATTTV
jgi:hypothetical protein